MRSPAPCLPLFLLSFRPSLMDDVPRLGDESISLAPAPAPAPVPQTITSCSSSSSSITRTATSPSGTAQHSSK